MNGVGIFYDISNRDSFNKLHHWMIEVVQYALKASMLLVGTKCDLDANREVTFEEGLQFAQSYGISFIETSAKENQNVNKLFKMIIQPLLKNHIKETVIESKSNEDNYYKCIFY